MPAPAQPPSGSSLSICSRVEGGGQCPALQERKRIQPFTGGTEMIRRAKSGFTLVEILIVVIILGILAAIVIPQFTNASQDARKSSLVSQLQTLRSQSELYKLQHGDVLPNLVGGDDTTTPPTVTNWSL